MAGLDTRIVESPRYHGMGLPGTRAELFVREGCGVALRAAAALLPEGLTLVVWDGYRSLETQAALYNGYLDQLIAVHSDWPADLLEEEAARYVTPPSPSLVAPPPHLTGGAVDVTLADASGEFDLGTAFDAFVPEAGALAMESTPGPARDNRRTLHWAMIGAGFAAYVEEWWHYDFGDQFWGLATGRPARYGPAPPPV